MPCGQDFSHLIDCDIRSDGNSRDCRKPAEYIVAILVLLGFLWAGIKIYSERHSLAQVLDLH